MCCSRMTQLTFWARRALELRPQCREAVIRSLSTLGVPVVAAINGFALGGGCEIAMACTLRVASEKARFGQPEVKLGVIPGYGGSQRLPRLVGRGAALKLLMTGAVIDAREALRGTPASGFDLEGAFPAAVEPNPVLRP